jgi:enamine deaminase RidA (YjgF/YER057c/UK114 family)
MTDIFARLSEMGLALPKAAAPAANYVPYVLDRGTLYISGQLPIGPDGALIRGRLGDDMDVEAGAAVGVPALPLGAAVEVEAVFAVRA